MDIIKPILQSLLLPSFIYSVNVHSNECQTYIDKTISPISFDKAYSQLNTVSPKNEFETTKDYQARIEHSVIPEKLIISKQVEKNADDSFLKYNADKEELSIYRYAFHNTNIGIWKATESTQPKLKINMMNTNFSVITSNEISHSNEVASNSFGVQTKVTNTNYIVSVIVDPITKGIYSNLFPKFKENKPLGTVHADTQLAKSLKKSSYLAFVIKPVLPLKSTAKWSFPIAKIDSPFQNNYEGKILVANFKCGLWLDSSNKVIGSYRMD